MVTQNCYIWNLYKVTGTSFKQKIVFKNNHERNIRIKFKQSKEFGLIYLFIHLFIYLFFIYLSIYFKLTMIKKDTVYKNAYKIA